MTRGRNFLIDLRMQARNWLGGYPSLYLPLIRLRRSRRDLVVTPDTEVVVEGYPRSANTFAVAAFMLAQGRPMRIARHLHVPAQVIQATRWGIPTIVMIRKPEDAVLSLMVREPRLSARRGFLDYLWYYRRIVPFRSSFLLGTFEDVTSDFGAVIDRLNTKTGSEFKRFDHNEENVNRVMRMVETMDKADRGKETVTEATVARPSIIRERLKEDRRNELVAPAVTALMRKARAVYDEMLAPPAVPPVARFR